MSEQANQRIHVLFRLKKNIFIRKPNKYMQKVFLFCLLLIFACFFACVGYRFAVFTFVYIWHNLFHRIHTLEEQKKNMRKINKYTFLYWTNKEKQLWKAVEQTHHHHQRFRLPIARVVNTTTKIVSNGIPAPRCVSSYKYMLYGVSVYANFQFLRNQMRREKRMNVWVTWIRWNIARSIKMQLFFLLLKSNW